MLDLVSFLEERFLLELEGEIDAEKRRVTNAYCQQESSYWMSLSFHNIMLKGSIRFCSDVGP